MATLRGHIQTLRQKMDASQRERKVSQKAEVTLTTIIPAGAPSPLDNFSCQPEIKALIDVAKASLSDSMQRYNPNITAANTAPTQPSSPYIDMWFTGVTYLCSHPTDTIELPLAMQKLAPYTQRFYKMLKYEINFLQNRVDNGSRRDISLLKRLKSAEEAFINQRLGDVETIFSTSLKTDPSNQVLAFIISQYRYYQVAQGKSNALPEARNDANKAMISSDQIPLERSLYYRIESILCERGHSPQTALDWLRENYLLGVDYIVGKDGLFAKSGIYAKSWLILASIPVKYWGEYEFSSLTEFTEKVIGGALFYLACFRTDVLKGIKERRYPAPNIEDLESKLALAQQYYQQHASSLKAHWPIANTEDKPQWTLYNRYLSGITTNIALPSFEEVLLNTSLNGRNFNTFGVPQNKITDTDIAEQKYWRIWALAVSPLPASHSHTILPAAEKEHDIPFMADCVELLKTLKEAEADRITIDPMQLDLLAPHMTHWTMDHLLAAGIADNKPRAKFEPTVQPFATLYRHWSQPSPSHILTSALIQENALNGGFSSIYEVLSAFEGAYRLLDDPNHGLKAQIKQAEKALQKAGKGGLIQRTSEMGIGDILLSFLLPMAIISFLGFSLFSASGVIQISLTLAGILASVIFMIYRISR